MRWWLAATLALAACDDPLDQRLAVVDEPRLLAIVSEPAEVLPGEMVTLSALVADRDGTVDAAPAWALCAAPKPPTEDNVVAAGCLDDEVDELGAGATTSAQVPADACLRFGPDTTMPGFRPRDADGTGGYYQPVRATVADMDLVGFGLTRIQCNLPTAPPLVAADYRNEYVRNVNPSLSGLDIDGDAAATAPADTDVVLTASWPVDAAETFVYFDPPSQTLVDRREALRVSWFATGGTLAVDASAVAERDDATAASTTWHTPAAGAATLWVVLRDSRGGIATAAVDVDVAP